MDKVLSFKVFCLEIYKAAHNLTGKDAIEVFQKYKVFDYITDFYDILHSFGELYLINDLNKFIARRENPGD